MADRNREEILWAAGWFEGEGCFCKSMKFYPTASAVTTDKDVLERFVKAVGIKVGIFRRKQDKRKATYKQAYQVTYSGMEAFQALGTMLWPGLGKRRREKFKELLLLARAHGVGSHKTRWAEYWARKEA